MSTDAVPAEIRLLRGIPTRVTVDAAPFMLGIQAFDSAAHSARVGIYQENQATAVELVVGSAVRLGTVAYTAVDVGTSRVVLRREEGE